MDQCVVESSTNATAVRQACLATVGIRFHAVQAQVVLFHEVKALLWRKFAELEALVQVMSSLTLQTLANSGRSSCSRRLGYVQRRELRNGLRLWFPRACRQWGESLKYASMALEKDNHVSILGHLRAGCAVWFCCFSCGVVLPLTQSVVIQTQAKLVDQNCAPVIRGFSKLFHDRDDAVKAIDKIQKGFCGLLSHRGGVEQFR